MYRSMHEWRAGREATSFSKCTLFRLYVMEFSSYATLEGFSHVLGQQHEHASLLKSQSVSNLPQKKEYLVQ